MRIIELLTWSWFYFYSVANAYCRIIIVFIFVSCCHCHCHCLVSASQSYFELILYVLVLLRLAIFSVLLAVKWMHAWWQRLTPHHQYTFFKHQDILEFATFIWLYRSVISVSCLQMMLLCGWLSNLYMFACWNISYAACGTQYKWIYVHIQIEWQRAGANHSNGFSVIFKRT